MRACPQCGLRYRDDTPRCFVDGADLEEVADERLGTVLRGRYEIVGVLGQGGMATVYRAMHRVVDRPVAVKILDPEHAADASMRERFRREAKNTAALAHPNIVEIEDWGDTDDGTAYLVMELLEGMPLNEALGDGPMPASQVASIGMQIARGLARAHDFGVVHRDLKPENVFLAHDAQGRQLVKLLDFGIARSLHDPRLTNRGEIFGTPQYMAPERVTSIDAGPAADLYALGVMLFEMLTGRLPFESQELTGFLVQHMHSPPPHPSALVADCPRELEKLILELLEKKPEDRPVDAHQVVKALSRLVPRNARESVPMRTTTGHHQVAPTLPPATIEHWRRRTSIFRRMLDRAYPDGQVPVARARTLEELESHVDRLEKLRARSLEDQRALEQSEAVARERRERLGHAVETLAQDLSQAREAERAAHREVQPYVADDAEHEAAYRAAHAALEAAGGYRALDAPVPAFVKRLRQVADAVDRWSLARDTRERAAKWAAAKEREVADLDFQVQALRARLAAIEAETDPERTARQEALEAHGRDIEKVEGALLRLATLLAESLRPRPELRDLFRELEGS